MFIVDLLIIVIIALSTFLAYKKGLVSLAVKLCAVIIAFVVTLILYKPIVNFIIYTTNIDETIQNAIMEKSFEVLTNNGNNNLTIDVIEQAKDDVITQTSKELSIQIINVSVFLILYFVIKIALRFVTAIANKIASLPILNTFNKIGGLIFGLVRGLAIVYVCLLLIGFAGEVDPNNSLHKSVESSSLGKMMYEHNLLEGLIK